MVYYPKMGNIVINIPDESLKKSGIEKKERHSIKHSKDSALEEHEKEALLKTIKELNVQPETKYRYEVLVHLMMNAGLRVSEALQVRLDWFNEADDGIIINIPDKARDLANMKRDWKPKTLAGKREVFFIDKAVGEKVRSYFIQNKGLGFTRQRAYQVMKMLGFNLKYNAGDKIKCPKCNELNKIPKNPSKGILECNNCENKILESSLHPHALRSTYANKLVYAGVTESTLCYYMGWNNLQTAVNYVKTSNVAARKDLIKKFAQV